MGNHRCSLPLCDEIIYNVWSQAASSVWAPANDFLWLPLFLATMEMDFIFSAAGYTVRVGGDGETARVEGKFLQSEESESCLLLKNTTCLGAELLSRLKQMQMRKTISATWWMFRVPGLRFLRFGFTLNDKWLQLCCVCVAPSMLLGQSKDSSPHLLIKVEGKVSWLSLVSKAAWPCGLESCLRANKCFKAAANQNTKVALRVSASYFSCVHVGERTRICWEDV